ncbi:MAG: hypothetical protein NTY35_12315 [Planctomycetota bacterium]|nr:hypothetical protein [Planctomycetota bacterium]
MAILWSAALELRTRTDFALVQASLQSNHLHGIVEARSAEALADGMRCLLIRLARRWNRSWNRRGPVFDGAYHARSLRSPREARDALVYVLQNGRKHGVTSARELDPFSSAAWFDGWAGTSRHRLLHRGPLAPARTWLLQHGWRIRGSLDRRESPRPSRSPGRAGLVDPDAG